MLKNKTGWIYFSYIVVLCSINFYFCRIKLYSIMDFRTRIKELCQEQDITQKDLAEKMGISDISLNKTLRGEYPQLQTLEKIANTLNVPIVELFEKPNTGNIVGFVKVGDTVHEVKSAEDVKELAERL